MTGRIGRIQADVMAWLQRVGEPCALKWFNPPRELCGYDLPQVTRAMASLEARGIVIKVNNIPAYRLKEGITIKVTK